MGVVVTFDYASWVARYPEFAAVSQPTAQEYFNEATMYCRNDGGGPVPTAAIQSTLLNMLTAHLAFLYSGANGEAPSQLVGRISDAAEGSVHVAVEMPTNMSAAAAFFTQTKYGLAFWQATVGYRTARYRARPQFVVGGRWPMIGGY
jgi:hypothetical protein